jgi:hypothetical protein
MNHFKHVCTRLILELQTIAGAFAVAPGQPKRGHRRTSLLDSTIPWQAAIEHLAGSLAVGLIRVYLFICG